MVGSIYNLSKRYRESYSPDPTNIKSLIAELGNPDGLARLDAIHALATIGSPAVPALIDATTSPNEHTRWEATRVLGEIRDPVAIPALVNVLKVEPKFSIRWMAGNALITMKREALPVLLQALIEHSDSNWLREGAYHVVRALIRRNPEDIELLKPLASALRGSAAADEVPHVAQATLNKLRA